MPRTVMFMVPGRVLLVPLVLLAVGCRSDGPDHAERASDVTTPAAPTSAPSTTVAETTTTTAVPPTTTTAALVPAGPETVETVIGRSTIRFTYPANLTAEEREVLDTYHRFLHAMWAASDPPDPKNQTLVNVLGVDYKAKLLPQLEQERLTGTYSFGNYDSHPQRLESLGDAYRFNDCSLDQLTTYSREGVIVSPPGTTHDGTLVVLERTSFSWVVRTWIGTHEVCTP